MAAVALGVAVGACGSTEDGQARVDVLPDAEAPLLDAGREAAPADAGPPPKPKSAIEHVVVVVMENHTFDSYFGHWCTAKAGSNPTCNDGPSCCEGAPASIPGASKPALLDDGQNGGRDPDHTQACEASEMNGGAMDQYATGPTCANAANFAIAATDGVAKPYLDLAAQYAVADRYFQPIIGQSSSNDMYFAVANWVFTDNAFEPAAVGHGCSNPFANTTTYTGKTTIADVLLEGGVTFKYYAQGLDAMYAAKLCPSAPPDCQTKAPTLPCTYDPGDVPFEYYAQFQNNRALMKDYDDDFVPDVANGTLPAVSFVKAVMYKNEHPGYGNTISKGVTFATGVVDQISSSPKYADNTLVLITWDEGGGFYDHVTPPPTSLVDNQPYGTRVPLLAVGRFAKKGFVSHVTMEHSSIVKFLEQNFLGETGQLGARDAVVADIGSLLDGTTTGVTIPED